MSLGVGPAILVASGLVVMGVLFSFAMRAPHSPLMAAGATFSFSPSAGQVRIGDTVNVALLLTAPDQSVNAMSGKIVIPDALEVVAISTEKSVNTLWMPRDPYFSADDHAIVFDGGLLNPGFMGQNGKVIDISLRAKTAGRGELTVTDIQLLANDGQGSDVPAATDTVSFIVTSGVPGDLNGDGKVSLADVSVLIANWGSKNMDADLNGDGAADLKDLSILMTHIGK